MFQYPFCKIAGHFHYVSINILEYFEFLNYKNCDFMHLFHLVEHFTPYDNLHQACTLVHSNNNTILSIHALHNHIIINHSYN